MNKFENEVSQGRPRMALVELIEVLKEMNSRLDKLEANCDCGDKPAVKKTASKKKVAAKKTAAAKEEESSDEE